MHGDLDDRWRMLEMTDPTVATAMQAYRRGDLGLPDALRSLVITLVDQRDAIQAELLRSMEHRGPSPLDVAAETYAQFQATQQAAVAQAVSAPAMLLRDGEDDDRQYSGVH